MSPDENKPAAGETGEKVKIYLLPNLLTAGNLACGFFALTWMFKYQPGGGYAPIHIAIRLILAAFLFDFFDGQVARISRKQSQFGREFDSLADIVSFGVAPAFLVYQVVLYQFERTGWLIAAMYLVCGGIRLARFNILSLQPAGKRKGEFVGFPIPSAAALVVSMTLFMIWLVGHEERELGASRWVLMGLMVLLSVLMVSNVRYPSFKSLEWTLQRGVAALAGAILLGLLLVAKFEVTIAGVFVLYLLYGLLRPWVSKRWRHEIEDDEDETTEEP